MKLGTVIYSIALAAVAAIAPISAQAQAWPGKQPIKFVVPYPPGGASDVTARVLAVKLSESLGQSVVVENRPGANGILALDLVAKAPADGYTILMANLGPNAINPGVYHKLPYDSIKGFTPITLTSLVPLVVLVAPTLPVKSMPELIAYAKANPGKLTYASAGNGSANHLAGEMMQTMTGMKMVHVPYKGDAPAVADVSGGMVSMMFPTVVAGIPHVKSGRLRALAVTSTKRSSSMPDVPTVSEAGIPGFEAVSWGGIMGPGGLPPEIVTRLNSEIVRILKMPDVAEKLSSLGAEIVGSTPEEFGTYLKAEIAKWGKVAHDNNIKLD
jgi:tripartite-type tricarboxylate transporter receptor subunit TctC